MYGVHVNVQCTVFVHCTLSRVYVYNALCVIYTNSIHCTLYTVQCTLYKHSRSMVYGYGIAFCICNRNILWVRCCRELCRVALSCAKLREVVVSCLELRQVARSCLEFLRVTLSCLKLLRGYARIHVIASSFSYLLVVTSICS